MTRPVSWEHTHTHTRRQTATPSHTKREGIRSFLSQPCMPPEGLAFEEWQTGSHLCSLYPRLYVTHCYTSFFLMQALLCHNTQRPSINFYVKGHRQIQNDWCQWVPHSSNCCDVVHVHANRPVGVHMHMHVAAFSASACCKAHCLLGFAICLFTTVRNSGPLGAGKEPP